MSKASLTQGAGFALIILAASMACGLTQEPEPGPERQATNVRGWILTPDSAVRLQLSGAEATEGINLASGGEGGISVSSDYREARPGNYLVELKSGDEVVASARGALRASRHYTAVVWRNGSKWELKVFADDVADANTVDRPLRVLNFADERETLVSFDAGAETRIPQQAVQETKAPAALGMVNVKVLAPDGGPPAHSSVEVDFKVVPSAYVVIGPDYRGRMRPRVVIGGPAPELPEEPAEPAPAVDTQS